MTAGTTTFTNKEIGSKSLEAVPCGFISLARIRFALLGHHILTEKCSGL
jgi:hypothetical protein